MPHPRPLVLLAVALVVVPLPPPAFAQPAATSPSPSERVHTVPFGSKGNVLELAIAEPGDAPPLLVRVVEAPTWVQAASTEEHVQHVNGQSLARFSFDLTHDAPVGETGTLRLAVVVSGMGREEERALVEKVVQLKASAPEAFSLIGAFPNPFGGDGSARATVAYELPTAAEVTLEVYDVLGRHVATVAAGEQEAGRHAIAWNANHAASGTYLWRLVVEGATTKEVEHGRLMLVR